LTITASFSRRDGNLIFPDAPSDFLFIVIKHRDYSEVDFENPIVCQRRA